MATWEGGGEGSACCSSGQGHLFISGVILIKYLKKTHVHMFAIKKWGWNLQMEFLFPGFTYLKWSIYGPILTKFYLFYIFVGSINVDLFWDILHSCLNYRRVFSFNISLIIFFCCGMSQWLWLAVLTFVFSINAKKCLCFNNPNLMKY